MFIEGIKLIIYKKNKQYLVFFSYHRTSKKAFNYCCTTELRNSAKYSVGKLLDLFRLLHDSQMSAIKQEGSDYE